MMMIACENPCILPSAPKQDVHSDPSGKYSSSGNGIIQSSTKMVASGIKADPDHQPPSFAAKGVPYYPINYYNYIYPGYNMQWNGYSSEPYCMPGYGQYATADTYSVGQLPYLSSPGYFYYDPMVHGKQAMNPYSWGQIPVDTFNGYGYSMITGVHGLAPSAFDDQKPAKLTASDAGNLPMKVRDTKSGETLKPFNKVAQPIYHAYQSSYLRYPHSIGANEEKQSQYNEGHNRVKIPNSSFQFNRRGRDSASENELRCGPRQKKSSNSSSDESTTTSAASQLLGYNEDTKDDEFQINPENARFFVIKSYSEDDVHKCIKYGVWSSTRSGNRKLNAAFLESQAKTNQLGKPCPIFLLFSVNGSGQFVGLAEMTGRVEFNKDMGFWQLDKWSGSFTVKWHVVKDIPNSQLRNIRVQNNENRPVTYSRDTQEIELKAGLDMLTIFKDYNAKSSILYDLEFYDEREKAQEARKGSHKLDDHPTEVHSNNLLMGADVQQKVEVRDTPISVT